MSNLRKPVPPATGFQITFKYALDRVVAMLALVAVAPLLACAGFAIWLEDRGPVFFRHERPGLGGRSFEVWKLRTMIVDADDHLDAEGRPTRSRVTRIGRVLRRTSIDELPQLVNIAKGEMSLVGPRPALLSHMNRYTDEQAQRLRMKPGVTGLAQVSGRNNLPWSQRIILDNKYIDEYSLRADVRILGATARTVFGAENIAPDRNSDQVDDLGPPRT